jgi:protein-L-isoaspartate(D-aspartate) O-methyltransferase
MPSEAELTRLRHLMVEKQIVARGVSDPRVLGAMREIRRHEFVDASALALAYEDRPVPIGHGQTISQPYIVAWMSELLQLEPTHEVLEIGTGCGYQTAVLARLCRHVYSVEVVPELSRQAAINLQRAGVSNATLKVGDGRAGWPGGGAFPRIITAAASLDVPEGLTHQLAPGGRMVLPIGPPRRQQMTLLKRKEEGITVTELGAVSFVPLVHGG